MIKHWKYKQIKYTNNENMLEFWDFVYMGVFILVVLVLKKIIKYMFIMRNVKNVITSTKTNGKDNKLTEGFLDCVVSSSIDNLGVSIDSVSVPNCERATWLFCDTNFDKLSKLLKMIHPISTYESKGGWNNLMIDGSLILGSNEDDATFNNGTGRKMEAININLFGTNDGKRFGRRLDSS